MGAVWIAQHRSLDAAVAIKLLRSELSEPTLAERFLNEARLLARVDHPAVVQVLDFGYTEQVDPFLVMELLRGESLFDRLERERRLTAIEAVRLLLPIAHGLAAVHGKQIVHRDLKPDNLFLAEQDNGLLQPKLVDFGVALWLAPRRSKRLTQQGGLLGSPEYMSPEQARGERDIDHRADIWGFCAVLFECVSGCRLYEMEDSYERVLRRVIEEPPTPLRVHGVDEPELWKILERGLRKDPDDRWPSMNRLGVALADWLRERGIEEDLAGASLKTSWARASEACRQVSAAGEPRWARAWHACLRVRHRATKSSGVWALAAGVALGLGCGAAGSAWRATGVEHATAEDSSSVQAIAPSSPAEQSDLMAMRVERDSLERLDHRQADGTQDPAQPRVIRVAETAEHARAPAQASNRLLPRKSPKLPPATASASPPHAARGAPAPVSRATGERTALSKTSVEVFYGDLGF